MDVDAFTAAHQADWDRLASLVRRRRRLTGAEVDELVASYRRTATHLSALRSAGRDPALTARLSGLLAGARAAVTGAHTPAWRAVGAFFGVAFPSMAYRARWWWLATAAGSFLLALVAGRWIATSPAVQTSLLSHSQVANLVNHQFRDYYSQDTASAFALKIWTNNVWVAAETLIFGAFLGVGTILVLVENALNLAIDGGLMIGHGKAVEFFTLLLPHGMLELSAVFLAAAAGLRMGWAVIDPGPRTRIQALAEEGRATMTIALGLIVVLATSGAIEAFVTPSSLPSWARIGIGAVVEIAFIAYVVTAGRRAGRLGQSADITEAPEHAPVAG
ncbi:MAG TPA: stage II sporulation protein M [Streptosporangiaceae bacterium]|nr:stage II sporulation protein M [Streptosporangiaceae bacterium]